MTFETLVALAQLIIVPAVGYLVKNAIGRITDRIGRLEDQAKEARSEIETKVSDEEWIRESMRLRNDVQRMGETLARIEGKTDSTLQLAVAVNRVASAIESDREENDAR